jgi:hypothetical protein
MKDNAMPAGLIISCGVLAGILCLVWLVRSRVAEQYVVHIDDVPRVFQQLQAHGREGSFAVFMFSEHGKPGDENGINLQFSIEHGRPGLDWVLAAPVNIRDERRVFEFLLARHAKPRRLHANGVTYLRVEDGDLVQLCQHIMSGLYGIKADEAVDLLPEGFAWRPDAT